jgi:hypothetical protein
MPPAPLTVTLAFASPAMLVNTNLSPSALTLTLDLAAPVMALHIPPAPLTMTLAFASPAMLVNTNLSPSALTMTLDLAAPTVSQGSSGTPCAGTGVYATLLGTFSGGTGGGAAADGETVTESFVSTGNWSGTMTLCGDAGTLVAIECSGDVWKFSCSSLGQSNVTSFSQSYSPTFNVVWHLVLSFGACGSGTVTFTLTV